MDFVSIIVGVIALGYALYMFFARRNAPEKIGKLEAMKQAFGDRAGYMTHFVFYTIVPLFFGLFALIAGVTGRSVLF